VALFVWGVAIRVAGLFDVRGAADGGGGVSRNKAKGTRAESAVVDYLRRLHWPHAERRALQGAKDRGDIAGVYDVVIEVKDHAALALAEWVDEATVEGVNADCTVAVVWHKRRGKGSPGDWYVTMTGATFAELLRGWERET
jgi:hypothetical protein